MRYGFVELAVLATATLVNGQGLTTSPPFYPSPWMNGQGEWASAYQKAISFVSKLTLAEKVNLTTGVGWQEEKCVGQVGTIPRIGFQGLCMQDSPLGVRLTELNSAFPAGVNVAATWDKQLAYERGNAMGSEHRDKGVDVQLGPVSGPLGRKPDAGRNWEGFAPDPVLAGVMMSETIQGIQDAGVIACAKHFILNEQEHFRTGSQDGFTVAGAISANIDDVTMHELYLWPFADAVRAGVGAIMCSYNQINNSYGCSNSWNLNYLLKSELDFQGFVMTDWGAHHSGVGDALAGADMSMPGDIDFDSGTSFWGTNLTIAVLNGTIPEWRLDDMATRIIAAYYKVGRDRYSRPVNFDSWTNETIGPEHFAVNETRTVINDHVNVQGNHKQVIREIGGKSTVLLKNDGALPLTGYEKVVGVFGEDAVANPDGPNACNDRSCDFGTLAMGWGSGTAQFPYLITPQEAIESEVALLGHGTVQVVGNNNALQQMATVASESTVCLVFGNADSGEGYITIDGNEGDRKNLTLWQGAPAVIQTVADNCKNTIVVLHTVGPVLVDDFYDHPNVTAILWAGLPGQESGNALVDVLYGRVNPGAKSPFTWGQTRTDYGAPLITTPNNGAGAPQDDFSEGIFIDYRRFDKYNIDPVWEFGFGLSYTTFEFSNLHIQPVPAGPYIPTRGRSRPAPTIGHESNNPSTYLYPQGIIRIDDYIYPFINSTNLKQSSGDPDYGLPTQAYVPPGATNGSPQSLVPAGGAPGGNPGLYDILYEGTVVVTNTGRVAGDEVPQAYVSLGGPNDAPKVLRAFDRVTLNPGQSTLWQFALTRRDVSNWDPVSQDWVVTSNPKVVYVGNSSRNLPLSVPLPPQH